MKLTKFVSSMMSMSLYNPYLPGYTMGVMTGQWVLIRIRMKVYNRYNLEPLFWYTQYTRTTHPTVVNLIELQIDCGIGQLVQYLYTR